MNVRGRGIALFINLFVMKYHCIFLRLYPLLNNAF